MIKVKVSKDNILISGHAMFGDYGKDIVCAAASSIVITSLNGILRLDDKAVKYEMLSEGMSIDVLTHKRETDLLILNMISLLKELEEKYSKNIKIYEEV